MKSGMESGQDRGEGRVYKGGDSVCVSLPRPLKWNIIVAYVAQL